MIFCYVHLYFPTIVSVTTCVLNIKYYLCILYGYIYICKYMEKKLYHGITTKCCLYGHSSVYLSKCVISRVLTLTGWFSHTRVLALIGWFSHSRVLTLIGWFSHSRVLTLIGWFSD